MNYIDLGLPSGTLWADCNVGANKPEEYGDYFNFEDAQKCGQLPKRWQMCELVDECKHEVCEVNCVKGMRFIGKNGNSIFMPFGGVQYTCDIGSVGNYGYWWSCTPYDNHAYQLYLYYDGCGSPSVSYSRAYGYSVRLIKNK